MLHESLSSSRDKLVLSNSFETYRRSENPSRNGFPPVARRPGRKRNSSSSVARLVRGRRGGARAIALISARKSSRVLPGALPRSPSPGQPPEVGHRLSSIRGNQLPLDSAAARRAPRTGRYLSLGGITTKRWLSCRRAILASSSVFREVASGLRVRPRNFEKRLSCSRDRVEARECSA